MELFNKLSTDHITDLLIVFVVIAILSAAAPGLSQILDTPDLSQGRKKLHITADSLVASQNNQHVIFSGNVVALYELTTITSDKLQVIYSDRVDKEKLDQASVKKIIASGNVHIELEEKTATCDRAVYLTSSNSLVLTGEETRLQSNSNFITGNKITIYQNTGQIIVNGSNDKRVNAVFQPDTQNADTDIK